MKLELKQIQAQNKPEDKTINLDSLEAVNYALSNLGSLHKYELEYDMDKLRKVVDKLGYIIEDISKNV